MNCSEAKELLQRRVDGQAGEGDALEQHLAACASCRELHLLAQCVENLLKACQHGAAPPGLTDRIVARVQLDRRLRQRWRRRLVAVAGVAAVLALLAVADLYWPRSDEAPSALARVKDHVSEHLSGLSKPAVAMVERSNSVREPARLQEPSASASLERIIEDAGTALVALTRRSADETLGPSRLLLPDAVLGAGGRAGPSRPAPQASTDSLRAAGEGMSEGLAPVTHSVERAVHWLLEEMPPVAAERKSGA